MEIAVHLGAHRTGSTTLQRLVAQNATPLLASGVIEWGPRRTRRGMCDGLFVHPDRLTDHALARIARSSGRLKGAIARAEMDGTRQIFLSDENFIGGFGDNLGAQVLYPHVGARVGRLRPALTGHNVTIGICLRSYERFWASSIAFALTRGHGVPSPEALDRMVTQPRRWRTVVREIAEMFETARIQVWTFESHGHRPHDVLDMLFPNVDLPPLRQKRHWHNASPSRDTLARVLEDRDEVLPPDFAKQGGWMPFSPDHQRALQAQYEEDLSWLRSCELKQVRFADPAAKAAEAAKGNKDGAEYGGIKGRLGKAG